jgi:hypothetical protein
LKIIERVESGRLKANQKVYFVSVEFQNCSSWVNEKKLYSVSDAQKDEVGLQRKKLGLLKIMILWLLLLGVNHMEQMFSKRYGTRNQ